MQFLTARKKNSVKELPGADQLYTFNKFSLSGCAAHSPATASGACSISALLNVGSESFKVSFRYADYSSEPTYNWAEKKPYTIDVYDGDQKLTLNCYRIEQRLIEATATLEARFDEASFADSRPSFFLFDGDKQIGGRWILQQPTGEELLYAIQREVSRRSK